MTEETINPVVEERDAIARIALTADGLILHRYLRRVLEGVLLTPDSGALQAHTGRRTLARDLMAIMAEGIESTRAGRPDHTDSLLAAGAKPRAVAGSSARTSRRGADAPGWGPEPDAAAPGVDAGKPVGRKGRSQARRA